MKFLSIEPLLEDLSEIDLTGIHWVIAGGESGPGARPCAIEWIESIVRQCAAAKVPCFVKQVGRCPTRGGVPIRLTDRFKGADPLEWPEQLRVREFAPAKYVTREAA